MAISKQDKEYIQMTAKLVSQATVEACIDKLPCQKHEERISEHETILHNGLSGDVKSIKKNFRWTILTVFALIVGNYFIQFMTKIL